MRKLLVLSTLVVFALCSPVFPAHAQTTAKPAARPAAKAPAVASANSELIKLAGAGMSEEILLATVANTDKSKYNTSADALLKLKDAGVSQTVIAAILGINAPASTGAQPPVQRTAVVAPTPGKGFAIKDGTELKLTLSRAVSSVDAKAGQQLEFSTVDGLVVDGKVAIERDAQTWGTITAVTPQLLTRAGKIEFTIDSVRAVNGQEVRLSSAQRIDGGRSLIRGNEVEIKAGAVFLAVIAGDQDIHSSPSASGGGQGAGTPAQRPETPRSPQASNGQRSGHFLVFVSAPERDGFFDTSKDTEDSISDIRKQIEKEGGASLAITNTRSNADIILTVVQRGVGAEAYGERTSFTRYYGGASLVTTPMVANTFWVSTMMEVGKYKKEFTGQWVQEDRRSMGAWTICARQVGKNVVSWAAANARQITQNAAR